MSLLPNSRWLAKIFVWRISSSLSIITKQSLDVVGLKELEILHTQIFAYHLEFGNNEIVVWEEVQLEPCRDVDVWDVDVGCTILA